MLELSSEDEHLVLNVTEAAFNVAITAITPSAAFLTRTLRPEWYGRHLYSFFHASRRSHRAASANP